MNNTDDTIAAISTPIGEGGIGIVRLSGPEALHIADRIFVAKNGKKPSAMRSHSLRYGHVVRPKAEGRRLKADDCIIDEVLLTVMRAPRTYTKEDVVEINCHGGVQAAKNVLDIAVASGARPAEPGEFTKRAFLNGRLDLAQAEAVADVIRAGTERSLKIAVDQIEGVLSETITSIREKIIDAASHIEASIDFPEEDREIIAESRLIKRVDGVIGELGALISTFHNGAVLREGVRIILCGKPNVGKSSLMNLLLRRDRVIVSHIPGTTRDAIEEIINIKGIPIRLVDTAGIADTDDVVETEGIKKSKKYLELSDLAIFILDGSSDIGEEDLHIKGLLKDKKRIVVLNKCDLKKKIQAPKLKKMFKDDRVIPISAKKRINIDLLEDAIADAVWAGGFKTEGGAVVSNARHKELLDKALANMLSIKKMLKGKVSVELISVDLKEAANSLGLIIGKSVSGDILDRIFERFCIGK